MAMEPDIRSIKLDLAVQSEAMSPALVPGSNSPFTISSPARMIGFNLPNEALTSRTRKHTHLTVCVADANETCRTLMKNRLEAMYPRCEVFFCPTTEKVAKNVLDTNQIHILIIDDDIGDNMTAKELVQHIRLHEGHRENMIIARWSSNAIDDGLADLVWHKDLEEVAMTNHLQDVVHGRFPHLHEAAKVPISKEARNEQIQLKADLSEIIRRQKEQMNEMRRLGPDATTFVTEEDYEYVYGPLDSSPPAPAPAPGAASSSGLTAEDLGGFDAEDDFWRVARMQTFEFEHLQI